MCSRVPRRGLAVQDRVGWGAIGCADAARAAARPLLGRGGGGAQHHARGRAAAHLPAGAERGGQAAGGAAGRRRCSTAPTACSRVTPAGSCCWRRGARCSRRPTACSRRCAAVDGARGRAAAGRDDADGAVRARARSCWPRARATAPGVMLYPQEDATGALLRDVRGGRLDLARGVLRARRRDGVELEPLRSEPAVVHLRSDHALAGALRSGAGGARGGDAAGGGERRERRVHGAGARAVRARAASRP